MSAFGPPPETVPQNPFHLLERPLRHDVAMIIHPSPDHRVELTDQFHLAEPPTLAGELPHLDQEVMRVLLGGLDEQLAAIFPEVLSEEVEPVVDMGDAGFLGRELQAPVAQELLDQRFDFIFQQLLGHAGDNEVIRISDEVDFGKDGSPFYPLRTEALLKEFFQSIQSQVGQCGRDNPALWRACFCWIQMTFVNKTCFKKLS